MLLHQNIDSTGTVFVRVCSNSITSAENTIPIDAQQQPSGD
jgi:hypothetical protein